MGSQWVGHFTAIIGKRIHGLVVATNPDPPQTQVFLVFDDGTHYELFGHDVQGIKGIDPGGLQVVMKRLRKRPGTSVILDSSKKES